MKLRDHAVSKRDLLMLDPRAIKAEAGYNVRDLTTKDAQDKLQDLARSIADNGFSIEHPIAVRLKDDCVYVVAGHRRLAATMIAIEQLGAEIEAIPCIAEARGQSDADRCADLIVSNSGEPLTPLERATVIRRLIGYGWDNDKIRKRLGWSSEQPINNYLTLLSAPAKVQQMVRDDEVAASTVVGAIRKHGEAAEGVLTEAKQRATREGKTKATSAHVKATQGEFQATAGNIKVLIAALERISQEGDEVASGIAIAALDTVGLSKSQRGNCTSSQPAEIGMEN